MRAVSGGMGWGDRLRVLVVAAAGLASVATPAPRYTYPRNYPAWRVESGGATVQACAELTAWVSKSGKQGVGVTLEARSVGGRTTPCEVAISSARLVIDGTAAPIELAAPVVPVAAPPGGVAYAYLPFVFDNERLWNEGLVSGRLELVLIVDGARAPEWRLVLAHEWSGPHKKVDRSAPPPPRRTQGIAR